jgi:mono/diheme cytochrome c family protein
MKGRLIFVVVVFCLACISFVGRLAMAPGPTDFLPGERPIPLSKYVGPSPSGVPRELAGATLVERGKYLALAADCKACHTVPGGVAFAGGRGFTLPFGTLYTPNITPDKETGIGAWSNAEFLRAVHHGVGRDGRRLYPAFPYGSYALLTDDDVLAIKAYLFSLPPVHRETRPNTFSFPFNQRWTMMFWSALFVPDKRFEPVAQRSPQWNRGGYLVEAAAHCGECHTPRNLMFAMDTRRKFAGGQAEGWNAYNITSDPDSGIGAWTAAQLAGYLSSVHGSDAGVASGPMAEAVDLSLSRLTASDIDAMLVYLRTVPAIRSANLPRPTGAAQGYAAAGASDHPVGKRIFEGSCASCHAWNGAGALVVQARLTGVRAVNDPSATNVAKMVLAGSTDGQSGRASMPGFAGALSDTEIAEVANYVTERFGAAPSHLTGRDVEKLRAD